MNDLSILILGAGKGTRMKSDRAKVLHELCGKPIIHWVYAAVDALAPEKIIIVIGHNSERVRESLAGTRAEFVVQDKQLGTGHAVLAARDRLAGRKGDVIVLYGDAPRIKTDTLRKMVDHHRGTQAHLTLLTTVSEDQFQYGRIVRNAQNEIQAVVEEKDCTPEQRRIREINPGFYCFEVGALLESLGKLSNDNAQGEYYLTDLIEIERLDGRKIEALLCPDFEELRGINSRRELTEISKLLWKQRCIDLLDSGVTVIDPDCTYIGPDVVVERDVVVYPLVALQGGTRVGPGSILRSGARISDSVLGAEVEILDGCLITDSNIGDRSKVGPYARLRNGAVVGENCRIGNFVEIKKSTLGAGTSAAHLTYLGDATIGSKVNIGAGTITCNYDGVRKNATIIEDEAFIGSDSQLVAPVRIGRGAIVAAGSTITEDVPPGALAIARNRQANKQDWAAKRRGTTAKK